jgi:hypothetical protein
MFDFGLMNGLSTLLDDGEPEPLQGDWKCSRWSNLDA